MTTERVQIIQFAGSPRFSKELLASRTIYLATKACAFR
jgi:hypothetical protein